jgi:hypothetical protein
VWAANASGTPLRQAYADYLLEQQFKQAEQLAAGAKTAEANHKNAEASPGSVTGHGQAANSVLTDEAIENMSPKEMEKNWAAIKKHYNMK